MQYIRDFALSFWPVVLARHRAGFRCLAFDKCYSDGPGMDFMTCAGLVSLGCRTYEHVVHSEDMLACCIAASSKRCECHGSGLLIVRDTCEGDKWEELLQLPGPSISVRAEWQFHGRQALKTSSDCATVQVCGYLPGGVGPAGDFRHGESGQ